MVKCVCQNVRTEKHKTWEHFEWSFYVISTLCLSTLFFKVRFGISFNPRSLSCGTFLMRLAHCTMYTRIAKDLSVTLSHEVQVQQHISSFQICNIRMRYMESHGRWQFQRWLKIHRATFKPNTFNFRLTPKYRRY